MSVTAPYTTSAAVAYLLQVPLIGKPDFDDSTTPTKAVVDQTINWVSAHIDMNLQQAGYVVPLVALTGETWLTSQTNYIQLVATLGAAAMAGGYAQRPAPALGPGRTGSGGNVFYDLYQTELNKIYDPLTGRAQLHLRAQVRIGSMAEKLVTSPMGPTSDFLEGRFDPTRHYDNEKIVTKLLAIQDSLEDLDLNWDYMYGLWINKGLGQGTFE